jgi:hypothetical protein
LGFWRKNTKRLGVEKIGGEEERGESKKLEEQPPAGESEHKLYQQEHYSNF